MRWALLCVVSVVACVQSDAVPCGDRTCPGGTVCALERGLCIQPEQQTVCEREDLAEGSHCTTAGFEGLCQDGLCLPGCGDQRTAPTEECDDGNFKSHDGCSSGCRVEIPSWEEELNLWQAVKGQSAAFHADLRRLVMVGGLERNGLRTSQWQRDDGVGAPPQFGWRDETARIANRPPARHSAHMAYDSASKVLVLFGGIDGAGARGDTWEYVRGDPTQPGQGVWTQIATTNAPPARGEGVMAYHAGLDRVVLYSGRNAHTYYGDTWQYNADTNTWTEVAIGASPPVRSYAAMTYDSARGELVMFGGTNGTILGDTWTYAGTWTNQGVLPGPAGRAGASMTFLARTNRVVLFGGAIATLATPTETWEYTAGTWMKIATLLSPAARVNSAFVYDPTVYRDAGDGVAVLIGGAAPDTATLLDDVWEYDGIIWLKVTPTYSPAPRAGPMTYLPRQQDALIVGGFGTTGPRPDLWAYAGGNLLWQTLNRGTPPNEFPGTPSGHALAYDPRRDRVVLFGGEGTARTWELDRDSAAWWTIPITWDVDALRRENAALAWDAHAGKLVLFGGDIAGEQLADTWEYDGTTWVLQSTSTPAPAATTGAALAWDPEQRKLVLFDAGGTTWTYQDHGWVALTSGTDQPGGRSSGAFAYDWERKRMVLAGGISPTGESFADVWELEVATGTWTQLYIPPGGPLPRSRFGFVGHRRTRTLLLYGGDSGGGPRGDTWHLQWRSSTPDEVCDDGIDTDQDLQPDMSDPDCGEREDCTDTNDNDRDGLTDLDDPECQL